jgi:hypothetical protein
VTRAEEHFSRGEWWAWQAEIDVDGSPVRATAAASLAAAHFAAAVAAVALGTPVVAIARYEQDGGDSQ